MVATLRFPTLQAEKAHWTAVCRGWHRSPLLKTAAGGQDVPFEQAFSNLAHAYLKDRAPQLLDYEVGFQLLEKNDENNKAVGVFGFKVGPQWLYAPQFFLRGELKGYELLYLKDSDTFVPMQENWINYLLNRKPDLLGEEVNQNLGMLGVQRPDVNRLRESPSKYAAAQEPWLQYGLPGLMYAKGYHRLPKYELQVPKLVKESADAAYLLLQMVDQSPRLGRALIDCYGEGMLRDAIKTAATRDTLWPIEPAERRRPPTTGGSIWQEKTAADVIQETDPVRTGRLRFYKYAGSHDPNLGMSDHEELLRRGYLIKDHRTDDEVSRLFVPPQVRVKGAEDETGAEGKSDNPYVVKTQEPLVLQNPDDTNIYELLVRPHALEDCVVIIGAMGGSGATGNAVVFRKDDPRSWIVDHPKNLFTLSKATHSDYISWFEGLDEGGSLEKGGTYVLLGPNGTGTLPFTIKRSMPAGQGERSYQVDWLAAYDRQAHDFPAMSHWNAMRKEVLDRPAEIISIGASAGRAAQISGGVCYFPKGWKTLKLRGPETEEDMGRKRTRKPEEVADSDWVRELNDHVGSDPLPLRPGDPVDMQMGLIDKTAELKIWCDGIETVIGDRQMGKQAALFTLIKDYGLREKAATEAIQIAERAHAKRAPGVRFRIKYARPYDLIQSAPNSPQFPPHPYDQMTDSVMGSGVPANMPYEQEAPIPGLEGQPRQPVSGPPRPDPSAISRGLQAAQSGQREVLDTSMFSALLKGTRRETLIDRGLGPLMKGLDWTGRLLFNFYWHPEVFEEEFGKEDLPTLEDALRNSFQSQGDLVLELKQKTIEPYPAFGAETDLDAVAES